MSKIIRLVYGDQERMYKTQNYDPYQEVIGFVKIYFQQFQIGDFSIIVSDDDGTPIFPIKKIFNSQQMNQLINQSGNTITLLIITQDIQTYQIQYGQEQIKDEILEHFQSKDMKGLLKDLKNIKQQLKTVNLSLEVTNFLVGLTGSGKSTLVNFARKLQFQFQKKIGKYHIKAVNENIQNYAPVGNSSQSCTTLPGFYKCQEGTIFCDLAGFLDTNGQKQQILNSYSNKQLFKKDALVRIILVVQFDTFISKRGGSFVTAIQRLQKLFPYDFVKILKYSTMIVISKTSNDEIEKEEFYQIINEIINQNKNLSQQCGQFLKQILKQKRIFLFPKPSIVDQKLKIVVQENIHQIINNIPPSLLNQNASVSLSSKTQQILTKLMRNLQIQLQDTLNCLTLQFDISLINLKDPLLLGQFCTNISYAVKQLSQCCYFPYNIKKLIYAIELLNLKVNKTKIQKYLGNLIFTLKKCAQINIRYQMRQGLMDNMISYFQRKQKLLHQHLSNYYQSEIDLKEIKQQYQKIQNIQQQNQKRIRQNLKQQIIKRQQESIKNKQQIMNQMKRDFQKMKAENQTKVQQLRRRLG